ncbi:MAG TPA: prepilin-type N-terminal cleavage/methylation domain-containing protein [Thermoanaerobaculia bacterium]|nr:prepilin-type N-terminal cleavage/methylation domain-containing protein [Thermoanaerobaculia bacterium]
MPRIGNARQGFTLIELLIVIAIIGLIAAMLIPNLLDAMNKAKQKKTIADMRITGTAMFSWLTDQVGAAAAGSESSVKIADYNPGKKDADQIKALMVPQYMQEVPPVDGWKYPYEYYLRNDSPLSRQVMLIRSLGQDRQADRADYAVSAFEPTDYAQDIVWADGFFVRWPEKSGVEAPAPATP